MKKTFLISALLGMAGLLFFNACSDDEPTGTPPPQASIAGENSNICPATSVVLTASAVRADSYVWYNGTDVIPNATAGTYAVTVSGTYYATGVNNDGEGPKSAGKEVTIVNCTMEQATISGSNTGCADIHPTLTASAPGATSYVWYNGADVIPNATAGTYEVTASGTYYAAGVNNDGEGPKSAGHEVTMVANCDDIPFADQLAGTWNVTELAIIDAGPDDNNHQITIEKVDDTTIKIKNITGITEAGDEVTATLDADEKTITINYQEMTPTWEEGSTTHFAGFITDMPFGDNVGQNVTLTVEDDFTITWPGVTMAPGMAVTHIILLCQEGVYSAQRGMFMNTVWTKVN